MGDHDITPIRFTELDKYIGEPLWDDNLNRWRVLVGYRRYEDAKEVIFTDSKAMERWEKVSLTVTKLSPLTIDGATPKKVEF